MPGGNSRGDAMHRFAAILCAATAAVFCFSIAQAQQPPAPPAYGPPITLDMAKQAMAAAEAEAVKNNWAMVITILDSGGQVVMKHRMDNALLASIALSEGKARTAVEFKRPSKALEDAIATGGAALRLLSINSSSVFVEGGVPIVADGKIVGSIGTSGALSGQDAQVSQAGANAVK
jgi:glc operon protein GlcG